MKVWRGSCTFNLSVCTAVGLVGPCDHVAQLSLSLSLSLSGGKLGFVVFPGCSMSIMMQRSYSPQGLLWQGKEEVARRMSINLSTSCVVYMKILSVRRWR
ncbi:hypothetical protein BP00DRAFT_178381 [Aspergillus indologenus CBS 114.80]|uniref:Uncharacterized protein n=1 Tax=Aspergillus indologenus CBS 114.80 TaxID=1450541 RepID=A0A2V5I3E4_9EURO|nr:hypothetical protein BP00DRAFT_178381 [Aspergillus indologenus CBS 114.80]